MTKFVYKEVSGKELESATMNGWELVIPEPQTESQQMGFFLSLRAGVYLVRRDASDLDIPTVDQLRKSHADALRELQQKCTNLEHQLVSARNWIRNQYKTVCTLVDSPSTLAVMKKELKSMRVYPPINID